jgi:hypothetical protein
MAQGALKGKKKDHPDDSFLVVPRAKKTPVPYGEKVGRGRAYAPNEADRTIVRLSAACGFTMPQAASLLNGGAGVALATLHKFYADDWENGAAKVHALIVKNIVQIAKDPNHPQAARMAEFWARSRLHWRTSDPPEKPPPAEAAAELQTASGTVRFTLKIGERPDAGDDPPDADL